MGDLTRLVLKRLGYGLLTLLVVSILIFFAVELLPGDVAEAVANALENPATAGKIYELGGPRVYTMREIMKFTLDQIDRPRMLIPVPWLGSITTGKCVFSCRKGLSTWGTLRVRPTACSGQ